MTDTTSTEERAMSGTDVAGVLDRLEKTWHARGCRRRCGYREGVSRWGTSYTTCLECGGVGEKPEVSR